MKDYFIPLQTVFEPGLLKELEACASIQNFKTGDTIIDYGKVIRYMPIVLSGVLKVLKMDENGNEILLYYLGDTESCSLAYSCCLENKKSEIKAIAEEDIALLLIPQTNLDNWLIQYPSWRNYIMRSFQDRFNELLKTIESIAFHKLDDRLITYLKEKKKLSSSSIIKVSHNAIAEDLSTSRVVISRLLKQLENDKKILLYRNEIKLLAAF